MRVLLWPLECWAQSPLCLRLRLSSTNVPQTAFSLRLHSTEDQFQSIYFSVSAHPTCWPLGPKSTPTSPFSSLGHVDNPYPSTPVRGYNLPGHTPAALMAKSLDLTDLMQLPWGLCQVCSIGARFISLAF